MERLGIDGATIEYEVRGDGEPVLLIPVGVVADGLGRPLLAEPALASGYRLIHYHRRGYMGSTLGDERPTIPRQAADAAALLRHLGVKTAHAVGHSIGGLIALQLALEAPGVVHSLALLEPPLRMASSGKEHLERIIVPMMSAYRSGDKRRALEVFCDAVFGPSWQSVVERAVPGAVAQAVKDLDAFIQEQAAIQDWRFGSSEAAMIQQPVLSVLGRRTTVMMKQGRELLHTWFPQAEDWDLDTTHLLQLQDSAGMAQGLAGFFRRHPMT